MSASVSPFHVRACGWDPIADINDDLVVNIADIFAIAKAFGYTYLGILKMHINN